MGQIQFFDRKRIDEDIILGFDFDNLLGSGESIVSSIWNIVVKSGIDTNASDMLSGTASVIGTIVSQRVVGGVEGCVYLIECQMTTNVPQTIEGIGYLRVTNDY